jgi:Flp pilus assembly protein TadB
MSSEIKQSYDSHRRYHPIYHFVAAPILLINFIVAVVVAVRYFSPLAVWNAFVALALAILTLCVRFYATKNQDRIIRLEEIVRLSRVLPDDLRARVPELTTGQLIALRFCADDELPELCRAILAGQVKGRENIKRRIRSWRPDTQRV